MQPHITPSSPIDPNAPGPVRPPRVVRTAAWLVRQVWRAIQLVLLAYGLCGSAYLLTRLTLGESSAWVSFANNFMPGWALGGLLASAIGLLARRRKLLVGLQLPILIAFVVLFGDRYLPHSSSSQAANGTALRVATFNTRSIDSDPERIIQVIRDLDADIVGLEELDPTLIVRLREELSDEYPYQQLHLGALRPDVGLLSRYPILSYTPAQAHRGRAWQGQFEVQINGTAITVAVYHLDGPSNLSDPLHYDDTVRDMQIVALRAVLQETDDPTLVLCDCNMSDQSDNYHSVHALLEDTFREVGWGLGLTFPARTAWLPIVPKLLRLDYIWHSAEFTATHASVGGDSGTSDHYPVVAELRLASAVPGE